MSNDIDNRFKIGLASGPEYWESNIPCQWGCPVFTEAGRYVTLTAERHFEEAYLVARAPNPFASVCGRVCNAPCEQACRRGAIDAPVAIRAIKGFLTSRYGVEAPIQTPGVQEFNPTRKRYNTGPKVAVIGSGPGGLTAAHDLAKLGYRVTVLERHFEPGGLMIFGVPHYRLDKDMVRKEIQALLNWGVEVRCGVEIGRNISLLALRKEFKAVVIATGLMNPRLLPIEGIDLEGVHYGIELIRDVFTGKNVSLGKKVIIVGGGNVAFDACRTSRRLGGEEVTVVCLENLEEMPADDFEIAEGVMEGVRLMNRRGPKRIVGANGRVVGLETQDVEQVFDEQGRFSPKFIPNSEREMEADSIIFTIGQAGDFSFLKGQEEIAPTNRGLLGNATWFGASPTPGVGPDRHEVDFHPEMFCTNMEGVFVVGDLAIGPRLIIDAERTGQLTADMVHSYISKKKVRRRKVDIHTLLPRFRVMALAPDMYPDYDRVPRKEPRTLSHQDAVRGMEVVEQVYTEEEAVEQAGRCLKCHINTIFDGELCIMCNGCVDVCPEDCLKMVDVRSVWGNDEAERVLSTWSELFMGGPPQRGQASVMLKDEEKCIRCALCVVRCPTGAITMEEFRSVEVVEDA